MSNSRDQQKVYDAMLNVAEESSKILKSVVTTLDKMIEHQINRNATIKKALANGLAAVGEYDASLVTQAEAQLKAFSNASTLMANTSSEIIATQTRMASIALSKIDPVIAHKIKESQAKVVGQLDKLNEVARDAQQLMYTQKMLSNKGQLPTAEQLRKVDSSIKELNRINSSLKETLKSQKTHVKKAEEQTQQTRKMR